MDNVEIEKVNQHMLELFDKSGEELGKFGKYMGKNDIATGEMEKTNHEMQESFDKSNVWKAFKIIGLSVFIIILGSVLAYILLQLYVYLFVFVPMAGHIF